MHARRRFDRELKNTNEKKNQTKINKFVKIQTYTHLHTFILCV